MTRSLDEIADRLYGLPPATFVSARDDEVSLARAAGDRDAAKAIGSLRRPTVGAWMVNLLALRRSDNLSKLLELGAAMRSAQSNLKGDELRELASKRRKAIARLVNEAATLAVEAGAGRGGLPVGEVETTLTAALADADIAHDVQSARLVKTVQYDGFGAMPRPDLQLVPGGRSESQAQPHSRERARAEPAMREPRPSVGGASAEPQAAARPASSKTATKRQAVTPDEEPPKVSSAALARRRSAARKLHQAEVGLAAAQKAFQVAEQALRAAEQSRSAARAAFEAAERDLQE